MTDDELLIWRLNQYRGAEIRGAGVILRLGRLADTSDTRANFTKHLRDEGVHAWLWTRTIQQLGGEVVDVEDPYQARLGTLFGMPRTIDELLAVTLVSERRGVTTYEDHLEEDQLPEAVRKALVAILKDEVWHVDWIHDELEQRAAANPDIASAIARAEEADREAVASLHREALDWIPAR